MGARGGSDLTMPSKAVDKPIPQYPPILPRYFFQRAYARIFSIGMFSDSQRQRKAARRALELMTELQQVCKELQR
jgi:hypothetical protein